jgi:hypothetical protein
VRVTGFGQRQALRDDRVDLACSKQFEQRLEILSEPLRVARLPTHCTGSPLRPVAELWIWYGITRRRGDSFAHTQRAPIDAYHSITAGQSLRPWDSVA